MKNINWSEVKEDVRIPSPKAGGYVVKIVSVEDNTDSEYLKINFEIAEGESAGYCANCETKFGKWPRMGTMYRSYKESAMGMFKSLVSSLEKSNRNFSWTDAINNDPTKIKGLLLGVVFRNESYEYNGNSGIRLGVAYLTGADNIRNGEWTPAKDKIGTQQAKETPITELTDDDPDLPF